MQEEMLFAMQGQQNDLKMSCMFALCVLCIPSCMSELGFRCLCTITIYHYDLVVAVGRQDFNIRCRGHVVLCTIHVEFLNTSFREPVIRCVRLAVLAAVASF
jgi:hypothetical protein